MTHYASAKAAARPLRRWSLILLAAIFRLKLSIHFPWIADRRRHPALTGAIRLVGETRPEPKIMSDIKVQLPDGSVQQVPQGTTPLEIARSISPRLADAALVAKAAPLDIRAMETAT